MDSLRYWFLTSTTYGTWLPGDARGFVSSAPQPTGEYVIHNEFDTPYDRDLPEWQGECAGRLKGEAIYLDEFQATTVLEQFRETCDFRQWKLIIASVMRNHFHALVGAAPAVESSGILRDLKAYASRKLTAQFGRPRSETWWTESGSNRPVYGEQAFHQIYEYILDQPGCLAQYRIQLDPRLVLVKPERGA